MSLSEMATYCSKIKHLRLVQKAFVETTGLESWEDAAENLPAFANREALDEFTSIKNFQSTDR